MANRRISELAELTSLEDDDCFPVVDISASETDKNKRINALNLAKAAQDQTSGSSFPTQPAYGSNRPFYRTDLGWWCFYDGTRWLTCEEFMVMTSGTASNTIGGIGNANLAGYVAPLRTDYLPYFTRVVFEVKVATTNDGSKYWTINVRTLRLDGSMATNVHTFNTSTYSADTWYSHEGPVNGTASPAAPNNAGTDILATKTTTPGTIYIQATWFYRLIVT